MLIQKERILKVARGKYHITETVRTIRITYYFLIETLKKTEGLEKMYYRLLRDYRFQLSLL